VQGVGEGEAAAGAQGRGLFRDRDIHDFDTELRGVREEGAVSAGEFIVARTQGPFDQLGPGDRRDDDRRPRLAGFVEETLDR